jgi:predicted enzyme related to lactoylglutathione lyase
MPTFTRTHFVLAVPDLHKSADFYRTVLGFSVHEMGPGWLRFERDNCSIMAGECPDAPAPREIGDHSYFGYIVVEGIEEYHRQVTAHPVEVIKPLRTEPWGMREFGVRTADGHRLMFGEAVAA